MSLSYLNLGISFISVMSRILVQPRKLPHGLTVRIGFDPKAREPIKPNLSLEEELLALKDRVEFKLVFYVDEDGEKNIPADEGESCHDGINWYLV